MKHTHAHTQNYVASPFRVSFLLLEALFTRTPVHGMGVASYTAVLCCADTEGDSSHAGPYAGVVRGV